MHVRQRRGDKAERLLALMRSHGLAPDRDTLAAVVHARARANRLKDAVALLGEMKAAGMTCPEHFAFLLRQRCKAAGIFHAAVPAHPVGWQFTPAVMAKRRSQGRAVHRFAKFLRPKIGKYR